MNAWLIGDLFEGYSTAWLCMDVEVKEIRLFACRRIDVDRSREPVETPTLLAWKSGYENFLESFNLFTKKWIKNLESYIYIYIYMTIFIEKLD